MNIKVIVREVKMISMQHAKNRDILFPPGIKNDANICYANSILQCMYSEEVFVRACDWLKSRCNCEAGVALMTHDPVISF